ncbi:hypothetical protein T552_00791 [Pneumocystis carinii B80]|uniref:HTH myb-type domain-containing protein n=1 Tax=Pneumocystis carinii (strain B80) TaxID=1408658 RepID=A0A0W4ZPM0_PNEC8|nr:hypothetical protein T552_00791 [Pneumocystis carinii B80]KTW30318.1 hypothetical protein T552_00791 [Pneumocystis carinii B80]
MTGKDPQELLETLSKHELEDQLKKQLEHQLKVFHEELVSNDSSYDENVLKGFPDLEMQNPDNILFNEYLPALPPFTDTTEIESKNVDNEVENVLNNVNTLEDQGGIAVNDKINEIEDIDILREMLPDLQYHSERIIQLLIPKTSFVLHVKEATTRGTKIYKKKEFLLQTLKLTTLKYTKLSYIDISSFSHYLSNNQIYILFLANAALLLSELYGSFSMPPTLDDLKKRHNSLCEIEQWFPFMFNITYSQSYMQIIELRTQLFLYAIWLNRISNDHIDDQFKEDDLLKKCFMDGNGRFKKWEEGGKEYYDACLQRIKKIQKIRQLPISLETLIQTFPWYHFVKLMAEFIQNNILNISNISQVTGESNTQAYSNKETSDITPISQRFSMDFQKNDFTFPLEQSKEYSFNSENEGEISASDIKHLSQIVLDIDNDDNTKKTPKSDNKKKKSFFDKQSDYQKIKWDSQNENSESIESPLIHNILDKPATFTKKGISYNEKKRKYEEQNESNSVEHESLLNTTDSKNILGTDTAISNTLFNSSSHSGLSSLPSGSSPVTPSASAQAAMQLYKKSLTIQRLNSSLSADKNNRRSFDDTKHIEDKSDDDQYKEYIAVKQNLRDNKFRKKEYKSQHRVPWSETETNCLIKAIQEYGTQWSFILSLYGPNGTLSQDLAERGQVQLKDKARNIKEEYIRFDIIMIITFSKNQRARWKLPPGFETISCKYD